MHALGLLRTVLEDGEAIGHKARARALLKAVGAVVTGGVLSVTALGRKWHTRAHEKHRIKSADELLRNPHLHRERLGLYRLLAHRVLCGVRSAVIAVDWSDTGRRDVRVLRATVAVRGRSFVLWEEVYAESEYNRDATHRAFLHGLREVVPAHTKVLIVTDAGFRAPWFRAVQAYGWSWLARVRNRSKIQRLAEQVWTGIRDLYGRAGRHPQALGPALLNKGQALQTQLFLSKAPTPKRRGPRRHGEHYRASRSHREPWLLAASPDLDWSVEQALDMYATRMQIEQTFRDLKNPRHGLGLRHSNSYKPERVAVLLLIAALATFAFWLAGLAAEAQSWTRTFQANTERRRATLSLVYLGRRVLNNPRLSLTLLMLQQALEDFPKLIVTIPARA